MDKQELKEKIADNLEGIPTHDGGVDVIRVDLLDEWLDQLDEPKPTISGKEWLEKEVKRINSGWENNGVLDRFGMGLDRAVNRTLELLNQLEEPKPTLNGKEWLKEQIQETNNLAIHYDYDTDRVFDAIENYVNQLEEPETLSKEWIESHEQQSLVGVEGWFVDSEELENLIMNEEESNLKEQIDELSTFIMEEIDGEPSENEGAVDTAIRLLKEAKQTEEPYKNTMEAIAKRIQSLGEAISRGFEIEEEKRELSKFGYIVIEKPVIPQFVADWLEHRKKHSPFNIKGVLGEVIDNDDVYSWSHEVDNTNSYEAITKAWFFGYEIEKEPEYIIKMTMTDYDNVLAYWDKANDFDFYSYESVKNDDEYQTQFPEQEIREMVKGDILFEHFSKKVSEDDD